MGLNAPSGGLSLYLIPGMSVRIKAEKAFIEDREVEHIYQDGTMKKVKPINGFVLDNENVGEIKEVPNVPAIIYKHKKFEYNRITFYALTGEKGFVDIMSVPIHDHSSIVAGGPAYGTFFSDDETVTNET